jgi:hypothetical protein
MWQRRQRIVVFRNGWNSGKSSYADFKKLHRVNLTRQSQLILLQPLKIVLCSSRDGVPLHFSNMDCLSQVSTPTTPPPEFAGQYTEYSTFKGTVAWDFCPLVFFHQSTLCGPMFTSQKFFSNSVSNSPSYSNSKFVLRYGPLRKTNFFGKY